MFIIAIMSSVVGASYYLKTIKIIMFDEPSNQNQEFSSEVISQKTNNTDDSPNRTSNISPIHAFSIATCTAFLSLFILDSELIINSIELALITI